MFVTFEGIDGAGKTTAAAHLAAILRGQSFPVVLVDRRSPEVEDRYVARQARGLADLLWPTTPTDPQYKLGDHYFLHLTAAWLQLIDHHVIVPAIKKRSVVILDGWYYKAAARHHMRPHISAGLIEECFSSLSQPQAVFLLEIDPETAADRKGIYSNAESGINDALSGGRNGFIQYQGQVAAALRALLSRLSTKPVILNGCSTPDQIARSARRWLALMGLNRGRQIRFVDENRSICQDVESS